MGNATGSARSHLITVVAGSLFVAMSVAGPAWAMPDEPLRCDWLTPVDAEVIDGFRSPDHPYGPGNRGLEYDVEVGEPVRLVADGRVGFVGPVGGRVYVVVEHRSGLKSTYGPVAAPTVVRGQDLPGGTVLASAELGFHLTARLGNGYLDPQRLIDGRCGRARLVPLAPDRPRSGLPAPATTRPEPRASTVPPRVR